MAEAGSHFISAAGEIRRIDEVDSDKLSSMEDYAGVFVGGHSENIR